jgi:Fic family protein
MQQLNKLTLKQREKLFRQLRISITHHSNAIEGTTLSFGETKELLELGHTAGHKPLGEQLVILGFAKAYDVIVREATNPNNIIDSLENWVELREVRNELEHDYPEELQEALDDLKYCVDSFELLESYYLNSLNFFKKYI